MPASRTHHNAIRQRLYYLLLLVVVSRCNPSPEVPEEFLALDDRVSIAPAQVDFGRLATHQIKTHTIVFTNRGPTDVEAIVRGSCSCFRFEKEFKLPAGESYHHDVSFLTQGEKGLVEESLLYSLSPVGSSSYEQWEVNTQAEIRPGVYLDRWAHDVTVAMLGAPSYSTAQFEITGGGLPSGCKVLDLDSSTGRLALVSSEVNQHDGTFRCLAQVSVPLGVTGPWTEEVILLTDAAGQENILFVASITPKPGARVEPPVLVLDAQEPSKTFRVIKEGGVALEDISPIMATEAITVSVTAPSGPDVLGQVILEATPLGLERHTVTLQFSDGSTASFEVLAVGLSGR